MYKSNYYYVFELQRYDDSGRDINIYIRRGGSIFYTVVL
jgi:hypothetical protein